VNGMVFTAFEKPTYGWSHRGGGGFFRGAAYYWNNEKEDAAEGDQRVFLVHGRSKVGVKERVKARPRRLTGLGGESIYFFQKKGDEKEAFLMGDRGHGGIVRGNHLVLQIKGSAYHQGGGGGGDRNFHPWEAGAEGGCPLQDSRA